MEYPVLKPFNTANRRLIPGDGPGGKISDEDIFEPFTLADLRERKFLGDPVEENEIASGVAETEVAARERISDGLTISATPVKDAVASAPKSASSK